MTSGEHALPHDELMAYLDGELSSDRALAAHDHLAHCVACQALAAELQQVSRDMRLWEVKDPPASLGAPVIAAPKRNPRWHVAWAGFAGTWQFAGAAAMVVVLTAVWFSARSRESRSTVRGGMSVAAGAEMPSRAPVETLLYGRPQVPAEPRAAGQLEAQAEGAKVIRTISITITTTDFDAVRAAIDRTLRDVSGFVGEIRSSSAQNAARSLHATLRVPAARLDDAVRSLRTLGSVTGEVQSGDDVTERVVDIEARLANGRNTEKRLGEVLRNRTGDVSDVLAVEREIARVREEIERLDGERTNLERRVAYATVTLEVTESRQATLDTGPVPLSTRLRNAAIDGLRTAFESASAALFWTLRAGPPLVLWLAILWWPLRWLVRVGRSSVPQ